MTDARSTAPHMLGELPGFIADMDAAGAWQPVPILLAMAEPNGPVEQAFFDRMMAEWEKGLAAAGHLDGVYCVLHGAGLTTADHDPEGTLLALVRRVVGRDTPVVASYDLHANVSAADVELVNAYIGYRTNPHLDMRERGAELAAGVAPAAFRHEDLHRAHPPAYRAADRQHAHRQGRARAAIRRDDRPGPTAHARTTLCRSRAERLGDGRLRLRRHAIQRPYRRGHRDRGGGGAIVGARDRRGGVGAARAVPRDTDITGRCNSACQMQLLARWSLPTSPTTPAVAAAATRCGSSRRSTGPVCAMPLSV